MFTKKDKVLFIVHDVYQEDNHFPLGPAYLAAVLEKKGASVEAYCMDIFHYTNEQLAEHLDNNAYDIIGVGYLAARFNETVRELCRVINKHKKNAWLVLGSHGPSPIPEYTLRETNADIITIGEAEETIVDLLRCKVRSKNLDEVDGIAFMRNNQVVITGPNKIYKNIDEIPFPLWEIFPMERYTTCLKLFNQEKNEKSIGILTSRGCVNRCNFCYRMEKGIRLRSIRNIIEEIKILHDKYGVDYFITYDELFVVSKKRMLNFEKALKEKDLKIKFTCNARVDIMDKELIEILKRCGCQFINIGFESSSNDVLKKMNKNATAEQNLEVLRMIKEVGGIGVGLNFIWNNLGDTKDSLQENVRLIKQYNTYSHCRTIRPVTPYPGSDLYYTLIKMGKLSGPEDFFDRFKNSDLMLVNVMDMSDEEAYDALHAANKELILDHYRNTEGDMEEAERYIEALKDLYKGKSLKFRGTRHYDENRK